MVRDDIRTFMAGAIGRSDGRGGSITGNPAAHGPCRWTEMAGLVRGLVAAAPLRTISRSWKIRRRLCTNESLMDEQAKAVGALAGALDMTTLSTSPSSMEPCADAKVWSPPTPPTSARSPMPSGFASIIETV